ncbi:hypothetical protein LMG22037_05131 [Paraburkholderia phenoliruptrix]|uniref:ABC-three component systems C-terminal domain-containing protein n=2 Tax=Paraburkholderia phenoliruptrix TaxID=252970 RepID=A0A6J5C5R2_9BURK|nr:hypothetical protein LMG22037_05131 [Paraburkholderia phenoliruptrix]
MSLAYALHVEGYLKAPRRVAVVGAGAAGMTMAVALALISESEVVLFERGAEILPLQSATRRRSLDPHIYDWPEWDTDDPLADLPFLDWKAGPAQDVRAAIAADFEAITARFNLRLKKWTRHRVTAIQREGKSFSVEFERDAKGDEEGPLTVDRAQFDLVFIAVGFGLESESTQGLPNHSYWSDAGVPNQEFEARTQPRFFVSGNGDGALIDLVAAASAAFDHAGMIQSIVSHPGLPRIYDPLREIDQTAREAERGARRFDFVSAYERDILTAARDTGLLAAVAAQLRPGVQITLQTQHPEMFSAATSTLNRLAAFLAIKACETDPRCGFTHLHCVDVRIVAPPEGRTYDAQYWLDCEGKIVGADSVIFRRGPDRSKAREPFKDLLSQFEAEHQKWLDLYGDSTLIPKLAPAARSYFEEQARAKQLPLAYHEQAARDAIAVETIQVRPVGGNIRWSGTMRAAEIASAWSVQGHHLDIVCPDMPTEYGQMASALVRVATHAKYCKIIADPRHWRDYVERLTSDSLHAEGLTAPEVEDGVVGPVNRDPDILDADQLVRTIHYALDEFVMEAIDRHIEDYLLHARDPGRKVGFVTAADLRGKMRPIWRQWKASFDADALMRSRFLSLLVCAHDDDESVEFARVLVGPAKLVSLVRGTTVALAIAAGWQTIAPHNARPGNLRRAREGVVAWTGHSCAADQIDGLALSLCAASFMWKTDFVILSVRGSVDLAERAERSFDMTEEGQPGLDDSGGSGQIVMSIDATLTAAIGAGANQLAQFLENTERIHIDNMRRSIEPQPAGAA